ncbi:cytidine deaminase [Mucilaginibacter limnophilus]|uniref:Cytidine deaminase n=1 Tax=Mucilaginibacter limnophilus TaxID=1932778 RepID=A0A3S2Y244_9SPHI|nr:cytidine deaminase [Mucilaginibacter limnophilus]RVU00056.1 cytidine deaminase [Mucilaginibacter limnophilus]
MTDKQIQIVFKEYQNIDELTTADKQLCLKAVKSFETSHSPYSHFRVGAALQLESGNILYASNQENVAYPSGLCAERVALFHWSSNHATDPIITMAVTAHTDEFKVVKPVTSCGACLQVMAECEKMQGKPIRVLLYCIDGPVWEVTGVQSFLPFLFFEDRLTH